MMYSYLEYLLITVGRKILANFAIKYIHNDHVEEKEFAGRVITIGRSKNDHFQISSDKVSRSHILVTEKDNSIWILDKKSSNGTIVNGQQIPKNCPMKYHNGDKIFLGDSEHCLQIDLVNAVPDKNAISRQDVVSYDNVILLSNEKKRNEEFLKELKRSTEEKIAEFKELEEKEFQRYIITKQEVDRAVVNEKSKLDNLNIDFTSIQKDIHKKKQELNKLQSKENEVQSELQILFKKFEKKEKELKLLVLTQGELSYKEKKLSSNIEILKRDKYRIRVELRKLEKDMLEVQAKNDKVVSDLKNEKKLHQQEIDIIQKNLFALIEEQKLLAKELDSERQSKQAIIKNLHAERRHLEKSLKQLENKKQKERRKQLKRISAITSLSKSLKPLKNAMIKKDRQIRDYFKNKNNNLVRQKHELAQSIETLLTEKQSLITDCENTKRIGAEELSKFEKNKKDILDLIVLYNEEIDNKEKQLEQKENLFKEFEKLHGSKLIEFEREMAKRSLCVEEINKKITCSQQILETLIISKNDLEQQISNYKKTQQELINQIALMELDITDKKTCFNALEESISPLLNKKQYLEEHLSQIELEKVKNEKLLESLKNEIAICQEKKIHILQQTEKEKSEIVFSLEKDKTKLESQREQLQQNIAILAEEIKEKEKRNLDASVIEADLNVSRDNLGKLKIELEGLVAKKNEIIQIIQDLKREEDRINNIVQQTNIEIVVHKNDLLKIQEELEKCEIEINKRRNEILEFENKKIEITNNIGVLTQRFIEQESKNQEHLHMIEMLNKEVLSIGERKKTIETELDEKQKKLQDVIQETIDLQQQINEKNIESNKMLSETNVRIEKYKTEIESLLNKKDQISNDINRLLSEQIALNTSIEKISSQQKTVESSFEVAVKNRDELNQEILNLINKQDDVVNSLQVLQKDSETLQSNIVDMTSRLNVLRNDEDNSNLRLAALYQTIEKVQNEKAQQEKEFTLAIEHFDVEKQKRDNEQKELNKTFAALQEEVFNLTNSKLQIETAISALKQQEELKRHDIVDAEKKLDELAQEKIKVEQVISEFEIWKNKLSEAQNQMCQMQQEMQEKKRESDNMIEDAKSFAKKVEDEVDKKCQKKIDDSRVEFEKFQKNEEKLFAQRKLHWEDELEKSKRQSIKEFEDKKKNEIENVERLIHSLLLPKVKDYFTKGKIDDLSDVLHKDIRDVVFATLGGREDAINGEVKKLLHYDPEIKKRHKKFWIKVAVISFASLFFVSIIAFFPEIPQGLVNNIKESFTKTPKGGDILFEKIKEQRKIENTYNPVQTDDYKDSYVDNIIFTTKYAEKISEQNYQNKWIVELNNLLVGELGLPDGVLIEFVGIENSLIRDLLEIRAKIIPARENVLIEEMRNLERNALVKMKRLLVTDANYLKFVEFKKDFHIKH